MRKSVLLIVLFLFFGLFLRLYPNALAGPGIIGADGFFHSFAISTAASTGALPDIDPFSWGGRPMNYPVGFHLFGAALLMSTGISSNLLFLMGPLLFILGFFAVYAHSVRQKIDPLIPCSLFATIPVLVWKTTTNLLPDALWIFLMIAAGFLAAAQSRSASSMAILLFAGSLVHPIFIFAYVLALFQSRSRFRTFFILLFLVISAGTYSFLRFEAPSNLHQDVPAALRPGIFEGANPIKILDRAGPAFIISLLVFPSYFFQMILPLIPAALGLIELDRALVLLSLAVIPAAALFLSRRRNFSRAWIIGVCVVWAILKLSALSWAPVLPVSSSSLDWISENTPDNATILTTPGDGYLAAYVAHRRNFIDGHFIGMRDSDARLALATAAIADPSVSPANYLLITSRSMGGANASAQWKTRFALASDDGEDSAMVYSAS
jgi:hypothetical protein